MPARLLLGPLLFLKHVHVASGVTIFLPALLSTNNNNSNSSIICNSILVIYGDLANDVYMPGPRVRHITELSLE